MMIGEILIRQNKITHEELTVALKVQDYVDMKLGGVLVNMGLVGEDDVEEALRSQRQQAGSNSRAKA